MSQIGRTTSEVRSSCYLELSLFDEVCGAVTACRVRDNGNDLSRSLAHKIIPHVAQMLEASRIPYPQDMMK